MRRANFSRASATGVSVLVVSPASELAGYDHSSLRNRCRSPSCAPSGLIFFPLLTHGLRPFDKLRASCGLDSCAASRLLKQLGPHFFRRLLATQTPPRRGLTASDRPQGAGLTARLQSCAPRPGIHTKVCKAT